MIFIESKRKSEKKLKEKYPLAHIVDVTSKADDALIKLSPFYPHGDIPIPFSEGVTAMCVEGIWQGLKVFETEDIDTKMFENDKMKNIKRTVRKFGKPLGHRKGINGPELLDYIEARILIYLPAYLWVLENKVQYIITRMKEVSKERDIVLLDYATNCDVLDPRKPLSHAFLVKAFIEGSYPTKESLSKQKMEKGAIIQSLDKLKQAFATHSSKELSILLQIRPNILVLIHSAINENTHITREDLSKVKGVGKNTLQKISKFLEDSSDVQPKATLF